MIDDIAINFDRERLTWLNAIIGLVMFGVAIDLRLDDFKRVLLTPRAALAGLGCQFLLLPALTFLLVSLLEPSPSLALGMMLVAACPGGTTSNFMTHLARGNTALSVSLSAVSTLAAVVMTPANLTFWASLYPPTATLLRQVAIDPLNLAAVVATILGLPILAGMTVAARWPSFADRLRKPLKILSLLVFAGFIVGALVANLDSFARHVSQIAGLVLVHNALALATGYGIGKLTKLAEPDRRALAIEVGIQNTALGLVLIFDFFDGLGGMTLIAAWWGVWHLISGLTLATFWTRRTATTHG